MSILLELRSTQMQRFINSMEHLDLLQQGQQVVMTVNYCQLHFLQKL